MSVDWGLAARIGRTLAAEEPPPAPPSALDAVAAAAERRVVEVTGLTPTAPLPPVEWIGRGAWVDANVATFRRTVGPAMERSLAKSPTPLRLAGEVLVAVEIGALLGMFARRILGQYEMNLLEPDAPTRLLLVGQNLTNSARDLGVDRDQLVTWVTLHEVTHGVQFGAVGWVREKLAGTLRELLSALDVKADPKKALKLDLTDIRVLAEQVREGGLLGAVVGEERAALLDRIQATMSLVEGHAEWTMDRAGEAVLDDVGALRAALTRRRGDRPPLLKLLDRLLGMEMKLKQYEVGRRFCDAVAAERGDAGVREAWDSAEAAPTTAELADPASWLRRTHPPQAA